jgi:hypothetical protein
MLISLFVKIKRGKDSDILENFILTNYFGVLRFVRKEDSYMAEETSKRTRSPAYPFEDLEAVIGYAKKIYEEEDRHPFTPEAGASHWGYTATSSAVSQIISALKQFGLVTDEPGNGIRRLKLSPLALDIMVHEGELDLVRR